MNPIEYRKRIVAEPFKVAWPELQKGMESDNPRVSLSSFALAAVIAAPIIAMNFISPGMMIAMGSKGQKTFTGLSMAYTSLGYPMPMYNYLTPASPAYRTGARVGGAIGSFLSPSLHTVTSSGTMFSKGKVIASGASRGARIGAKVGGRVGARLIPGLGWGMLAYDVYDVVHNRSLWGFDLD